MILLLMMLATAADEPAPDLAFYNRARVNMANILVNQPNYTCIQTIDRSQRPRSKAKFETIDSLRLEVAFVDKREMYAWPGSKKFDDIDLIDLVPEGAAIATGAFAGHAQYLFRSNIATVSPGDWKSEEGTRYARFPFTVPLNRSRYQLMTSRQNSELVAYSGDIWIDPVAARAWRIVLHTDAIPEKLGIKETETIIEYGAAKIGESEYWLPARAIESITSWQGRTDRNTTRFSGCRAFTGESTLRFDDGSVDAGPPPAPPQILTLPVGVWFEIQFNEAIDSNKIHVGDPIATTLATDFKYKGQVLFTKGSAVEMRLVRIQKRKDYTAMEFATGDVVSPTAIARLMAVPDPSATVRRAAPSGIPRIGGDMKRPGLGTIYIGGSRILLSKGHRSVWLTTAPPAAAAPKEERN